MDSTVSRDGSMRSDGVSLQFPYQMETASALDGSKKAATGDDVGGGEDKAPEKPETAENLKSFSSVVDSAQSGSANLATRPITC